MTTIARACAVLLVVLGLAIAGCGESSQVRERDIVVVVEDDGLGGASLRSGSGLRGLNDRIAALEGTLTVDSPPGGGTRIEARIPCTAGTLVSDAHDDERAPGASPGPEASAEPVEPRA